MKAPLKKALLIISTATFLLTSTGVKSEASQYPEGVFFHEGGEGAHMILDASFLRSEAIADLSNPKRHEYTWTDAPNTVTISWQPLTPSTMLVKSQDENGTVTYNGRMGTVDAVFVPWFCYQFKRLGLGNFPVGHINYTRSRDRDNDGMACEM